MMKQLWLALGMGSAVFAGVAMALAGPGATWAQAAPEQLSAAGVASGLTVALLVLFIMVFLGLAVIDGVEMFRAQRHIDALLGRARGGEPVKPGDFIEALGNGMLGDSAKAYALTLRRAAHDGGRYSGADPSDFFSAEILIGDRLYLMAFRRLAMVLVGISAAALAYGLSGLLADYSRGASTTALAADGQAVLVGCAFPLFAAVVVGALVPAVVAVRRRQLATLLGRIGLLFHGADEQFYVRRLLEAQHDGAADLRRSLGVALGEIKKLFESLRRRIEDQPSGGSVGALEASLKTGLAEMSKAVTRLGEEQDRTVTHLVEQSLARFQGEFGSAIAGQLESLQAILKATESAAAGLGRSFDGAARAAQEAGARLDATSAGVELKLEQVVERLGEVAVALSAAAERRLESIDGQAIDGQGIAALAERLDRLGGALAVQLEEARGAAATMKQLHAGVDSLCLSVSPVLNRLVDTQDDLQAALAGENSTSRVLADVAEDLRQLSRTNRETVERHFELAGELVKVGQALETLASGAQTRPAPAPKITDGLMRALRELKQDTDEAARSLPSLDHVA
jgi:hypothetical protein